MKYLSLVVLAMVALFPATTWAMVSCTANANTVDFGNYSPLSNSADEGLGEIMVTCQLLPPAQTETATVRVSLSTGSSNAYTERTMIGPSDKADYNLYLDSQRLIVWGDGTGGSRAETVTMGVTQGVLTTRELQVYGKIPPRQDIGVGSYQDSVDVNLDF